MRTVYHTRLPRSVTTPGRVRRSIKAQLRPISPDVLDEVELVASELVSNAVEHGFGDVAAAVHVTDETVYIEVADHGDGFTPADLTKSGGLGLGVVDRLCRRWGREARGRANVVWCEIGRGPSAQRFEALA